MINFVLTNFNILGCLDTSVARDVLLVGSQTHVLAYDVDNNKELFHNAVRIMIILSPSKIIQFMFKFDPFYRKYSIPNISDLYYVRN